MSEVPSLKRPWARCKAIPHSDNNTTNIPAAKSTSTTAPYYTYYGPGELETYHHIQLYESVQHAKLQIWYPGVWHRPSPHALFRICINTTSSRHDGGNGDAVVLLHFLSNAKINTAYTDINDEERTTTLRWDSTIINNNTSNKEEEDTVCHYEHKLLSVIPSNDEANMESNCSVVNQSTNSCLSIVIELDSTNMEDADKPNDSDKDDIMESSKKLSLHIAPPPCITVLSTDSSIITSVEWMPIDKLLDDSTVPPCYYSPAGMEKYKLHDMKSCSKEEDYQMESNNKERERTSSWLFPHQIDLSKPKVGTIIHPTSIEYTNSNDNESKEEEEEEEKIVITCDFGRELLGHVRITFPPSTTSSSLSIQLRVGETLLEALNENEDHFEQSIDIFPVSNDQDDDMMWSSCHLLAFRYVRVIIIVSDDTTIESIDPANIIMACVSSEPQLNTNSIIGSLELGSNGTNDNNNVLDKKIWDTSYATLKLCIHHNFIIDGIKRDRLPWLGDVVVSLYSNAYSFHDLECIRWTLSVLGRCGLEKLHSINNNNSAMEEEEGDVNAIRAKVAESHVNGIVDYSLSFFICHFLYQRYFGDVDFLKQEWTLIEIRLMNLVHWCSDKEKGWFIEHDTEWIFIDWTVEGEKSIPLQSFWWWALDCACELGKAMLAEEDANKQQVVSVIASLQDVQAKLETSMLKCDDIQKGYNRQAHILGVISGLYDRLSDRASGDWWNPDASDARVNTMNKCRKLVDESRRALLGKDLASVATPYMKHLELLALVRLNERNAALDQVRKYWGGMLETGATTFYEAFNEDEETAEDVASFYDRPFARSLCHAWSAGPCALYPEILLGIRPLSNGWSEWTCSPLDEATTVSASVETSFGAIEVHLDPTQLHVTVPDGTSMKLMNKSYGSGMHSIPRSLLLSPEMAREWSKKYRGWYHYDEHVIPPNPIILGHEGIQMTDVPTVYQLPGDIATYYMSFVGFDGEGYQSFVAKSNNLVAWSSFQLSMGYGEEGKFDHGGVVLGAYLYESYHIDAPRVLKKTNDDKFISLYGAYAKKNAYEPDPGFQGLACSNDGINWMREHDESILSIHGPGEVRRWEKDSIYQPWLVEHDGIYYNFYNAKQMPEWIEQIGLARSQDLLEEWERHDDNPIIGVSKDGFDTQFCSDPKVFWDDTEKHWVMFYYGVGLGAAHIMVAFSRDLIHWIRDDIPLYQAGGNPSGIDKHYAHKVSVVYNPRNETYYMFYCAVGENGRGIGLITSKPL